MDYLLKKTGDDWSIINIITNGVSDLALKRSEYVAVIQKSGFDVLLAELSVKIDKFSNVNYFYGFYRFHSIRLTIAGAGN
jgi:phospholipid transport system substrate-binding protein